MREILVPLLLMLLVGVPARPALADADPAAMSPAEIAAAQANLAGRQRLLSQRMLAGACFAAQGVDARAQAGIAQAAAADFGAALARLRSGGDGLPPLATPASLGALEALAQAWQPVSGLVTPASQGDAAALTQLAEAEPGLLKSAAALTETLVGAQQTNAEAKSITLYVDVAGRQRMLSQRAVKAACLLKAGLQTETRAAEIDGAMTLYDKSAHGLLEGDAALGLMPAPGRDTQFALEAAQQNWGPVAAALATARGGTPPADLAALAKAYEPLLVALEEAVWVAAQE